MKLSFLSKLKKPAHPKRLILILVLVILPLSYFLYTSLSSPKTDAPSFTTTTVKKDTLIVSLSASGSLSTSNSRAVTTSASGVVKKLYVTDGQKVTTGTPLFLIDLDLSARQKLQSAYASYQSAQNNLASAQNKLYDLDSAYTNTKNIFDNQWASKSSDDPTYIQRHNDYLSAEFNLNNQQNIIKQAQTSLEAARLAYQQASATVYAPISGTVSNLTLVEGMILNPVSDSSASDNSETKIAVIKTTALPAVSLSLTEIDITKVAVGNRVTLSLDAFPDQSYTGKIIAIDTLGTTSSGVVSYPVTVLFDSQAPSLLPNMSVQANIITQVVDSALLIPSSAIVTQNSSSFVRVKKDESFELLPVTLGASSSSITQILSGLEEGQEILSSVTNTSATTSSDSTSTKSVFSTMTGAGSGMRLPH